MTSLDSAPCHECNPTTIWRVRGLKLTNGLIHQGTGPLIGLIHDVQPTQCRKYKLTFIWAGGYGSNAFNLSQLSIRIELESIQRVKTLVDSGSEWKDLVFSGLNVDYVSLDPIGQEQEPCIWRHQISSAFCKHTSIPP